ncbi:hypothetical protein HY405_01400 [Candidatus Microgenomates bacterium]|nr:hypothetical protein [Candidatus Microgenomates bacterium]
MPECHKAHNENLETWDIDRLRALLEAKKRVHHSPDDLGGEIGTNYEELDPIYKPLLEVIVTACLDMECAVTGGYMMWTGEPYKPPGDTAYVQHDTCGGTGYITRYDYWEAAPDGALEGALWKACLPVFEGYKSAAELDAIRELEDTLTRLIGSPGDTRQQAVNAVIAFLEKG